jgi:5-keto 4-deoxyuronate isomerase
MGCEYAFCIPARSCIQTLGAGMTLVARLASTQWQSFFYYHYRPQHQLFVVKHVTVDRFQSVARGRSCSGSKRFAHTYIFVSTKHELIAGMVETTSLPPQSAYTPPPAGVGNGALPPVSYTYQL